jgi:protein-S-isoprenylcysteine O-methyltransferase Ste14
LLFALAFVAGAGLQRLLGLHVPVIPIVRIVGIGLAGCGALLALSSIGTFLWVRTTIVPFSTASKLVKWGPYRFTRNPMYVSLILAYLGIAAILSQVLPLAFLPIPIAFVRNIVVPFEEDRMRNEFGATYEQYCSEVRRWL